MSIRISADRLFQLLPSALGGSWSDIFAAMEEMSREHGDLAVLPVSELKELIRRVGPAGERLAALSGFRVNAQTKLDVLRRGVELAAQDIAGEARDSHPDRDALRNIAYGLRLILAQTCDPAATAAAMIPDSPEVVLAGAETRPCETSAEEEAEADATAG